TGHQHALVVEQMPDGDGYYTRGIFSLTQIGRQLGVEIDTSDRARSFADIEKMVAVSGTFSRAGAAPPR
ncbi:MAG: hypothetical protein HKO62_12005, partial [Gammaproteobacteria bacterium]|nr:hypothetical protein [Gammaproteobacteria bacterium]